MFNFYKAIFIWSANRLLKSVSPKKSVDKNKESLKKSFYLSHKLYDIFKKFEGNQHKLVVASVNMCNYEDSIISKLPKNIKERVDSYESVAEASKSGEDERNFGNIISENSEEFEILSQNQNEFVESE